MSKTQISTNNAPAAVGPYSQAIKTDNLIFVSGQIPLDPATNKLIAGDIQEQTARILQNIAQILATQNLTLDNVVKTTVFITDMNQFAKVNETYKDYFHAPYPARSCVEISKLPLGAAIEIEVIAQAKN